MPIALCRFEQDDALEQEVVLDGDLGLPAVLDHDGLMRLDDDRGPRHFVAGGKLLADVDCRLVPFAAGIETGVSGRVGERGAGGRQYRLGEFCTAADRLDRNRLDHQFLGLVDESEA